MVFYDLITERSYKVVLLTSFIPTLINTKKVVISVDHFEEMKKYFTQEAYDKGIKGLDAEHYIHKYIVDIIGCEYTMDYLKTDEVGDSVGLKLCYVLEALGETNKEFVMRKNKYLINIDILDKDNNLREREELVAKYKSMVNELKRVVHATGIDIVGLNEFNYISLDTNKSINSISLNHIDYINEKIKENANFNIIVFNEYNKNIRKKEDQKKYWTAFIYVKNCQENGLLY